MQYRATVSGTDIQYGSTVAGTDKQYGGTSQFLRAETVAGTERYAAT